MAVSAGGQAAVAVRAAVVRVVEEEGEVVDEEVTARTALGVARRGRRRHRLRLRPGRHHRRRALMAASTL